MNEEIKLPEITPPIPPDIQPDYKPILSYINLGDKVRAYKNTLQDAVKVFLYFPIAGWILYGATWAVIEIVFDLIALVADGIDALWNGVVDLVNNLYLWWINFKRAVEERYNGNWVKAIIELTVRIILLWALDYALNIPAIKQLWDVICTVVQKINSWLMSVRNWIQSLYTNIVNYLNNLGKDWTEFTRYFLQKDLEFWKDQLTSLVNTTYAGLMKTIDKVDKALTYKIETVMDEVNKLRAEYHRLVDTVEQKATQALINYILPIAGISIEEEPWIKKEGGERVYQDTVRYTMPGQVESTYKMTITYDKASFSPQVFIRTMINEIFDDKSLQGSRFNSILELANSSFDELFSKEDKWYSFDEILAEGRKIKSKVEEEYKELKRKGGA